MRSAGARQPMSGLGIVPYLGAVTRVDATATAFAHRAPGYSLLIVSQWQDPRETEPNIAWAKETFEALHPYMANRSYVNNLTAEDGRMVHQRMGRQLPTARHGSSAATTRTTSSGSTTTSTHRPKPPAQCGPHRCSGGDVT